MSAKLDRIIKDLKEAIRGANKKTTSSLDTPATVTRIEGDTAWVHMDGGVPETPVKRTIDAKVGDVVQVRSKGGQAWLTGNQTAPPTDDTKAVVAENKAEKADIIAKLAQKTADKAGKTATNYLSWSAEYGLIVSEDATEDPEEMEGGSTRVTYDGVEMYQGQTRVAKFGETSIIGDEEQSYLQMDYHSMKLVDRERNSYLFVCDIRDEDGNVAFGAVGTGSKSSFSIPYVQTIVKVTIDGVETSSFTYSNNSIVFTSPPADGAVIRVIYTPSDSYKHNYKAYTLGLRTGELFAFSYAFGQNVEASTYGFAEGTGTSAGFIGHAEGSLSKAVGDISHAEGNGSEAHGTASHAEGYYTKSLGDASHAQGFHTVATENFQTVIGVYNAAQRTGQGTEEDPYEYSNAGDYAFIIGNGTGDSELERSNAFAVDWDGNVEANNVPAMTECGQITVSNVASHSYADYQVTFTKTFSSAPIVVVGMMSSSTDYGVGSVSVSAHSITTAGFTARIFNNDTSARSPYIHWIAMQS